MAVDILIPTHKLFFVLLVQPAGPLLLPLRRHLKWELVTPNNS